MLFRQIQYFQAVVEKHSFSEAAEICHISQSAISQQIKALEEDLGVTLLDRKGRSFALTPAGSHFYRKSLVILSDMDLIIKETKRIAKGEIFELKLGYLSTYSGTEFQDAIAAFSQKYPDIDLSIRTGNHEDLYTWLISGQIDLVLNDQRRVFSRDYHNLVLEEAKTFIEISSHHPFSKLESIEVSDLKNMPCIIVAGPGQEQTEADYYKGAFGFSGGFIFVRSMPEARLVAASGRGFLPLDDTRDEIYFDKSISRLPLTLRGERVTRKYCAFWSIENSGYYIEEFAEILKTHFSS
ncbi:MAG: LysR family transcriptional regulator [Firmicutes bacterium]|nr:LysR family transcriptional regulator [Bacillota bacterium]